MEKLTQDLKVFFRKPKGIEIIVLCAGLVVYLLGFQLPFTVIVLVVIARSLPMPSVVNSWFSRLLLSLLFLFGFLQIAATIQFEVYPRGHFNFISIVLTALLGLCLAFYRRETKFSELRILTMRDVSALVGCLFFLFPFVRILTGNHALDRITRIASSQVVDGLTHYITVTQLSTEQNLAYSIGNYYPVGFHIALAYLENGIFENVNMLSWSSHVYIYFYQYILSGMLLCFFLIYLGFTLLDRMQRRSATYAMTLALALSVGAGVTLTELLLFVNEGFLNFYYVCVTFTAALLYVFDRNDDPIKELGSKIISAKWPFLAFMLLTFGVAYSWPLLLPIMFLTLAIWLVSGDILPLRRLGKAILRMSNIPLLVGVLLYLPALYFQIHFNAKGEAGINASGAIHSFDVPILIVGSTIFTVGVTWKRLEVALRNRLAAAIVPFVLLCFCLMALQYFQLGQVRYFAMKCAMPLEMLLIVCDVAILVYALAQSGLGELVRLVTAPTIVLFVIISGIGMLAQPMEEVRELFRDQSGIGRPPYVVMDAQLISDLGSRNKIANNDVTVLHYESVRGTFFGQIETATWANAMARPTKALPTCSGIEFALLTGDNRTPEQQKSLLGAVSECIQESTKAGKPYYIVTDNQSAPIIRQRFGNAPTLVY